MDKLITLGNLTVYDEEIKEYFSQMLKEFSDAIIVQKDSFLQFPVIGSEHSLYIDTTTNKTYRWSESELKYYVVGSDYDDIKIINGNF